MKKGMLTAALALMLCMGLTSCGMNAANGQPDTETDNSSVTDNGPGNGGSDMVGTATPETQTRTVTRRTAGDYLRDGKYTADTDGKVWPRSGDLGQQLTQGARDLIRDAKELGKDLVNDADSAVKSGVDAARSTGKAADKTLRDKLE